MNAHMLSYSCKICVKKLIAVFQIEIMIANMNLLCLFVWLQNLVKNSVIIYQHDYKIII